jgi:hypothetical protein
MTPAAPEWPLPSWGRLALLALASRIVVLTSGLLLAPPEPGPHWTADQLAFRAEVLAGPAPWLEPWVRFDAGYYLEIARNGYHPPTAGEGPNAGFLPLLPACIALAAAVGVNPFLAAVLIPNAAFIGGLACAGRAALRVTGSPRTVWLGCGVLVTYPFGFYFSAPYQESLYLLAAAGGLLAWYVQRPVPAGVAGMVAALARLTALALPLGLFAEAPGRGAWRSAPRRVWCCSPATSVMRSATHSPISGRTRPGGGNRRVSAGSDGRFCKPFENSGGGSGRFRL